jgi:hypothetical protein
MEVGEPRRYYGNGAMNYSSPPTSTNQRKLRIPGTTEQSGARPTIYSPVSKGSKIQSKLPLSSNSSVSSHQSAFSSTSRLYRAPQPAVRIYQHIAPSSKTKPRIVNGVEMVLRDSGCSTRRRRKDSVNSSIASIGRSERTKKDKLHARNIADSHPLERRGSDRSLSIDLIGHFDGQSNEEDSDTGDFMRMHRSDNFLLNQSPMLDLRQTVPASNLRSTTRRSRVTDFDPHKMITSPSTNRLLLSHRGANGRTMGALKSMEAATSHATNFSTNARLLKQDSSHSTGNCYEYDSDHDSFRGVDDKITIHSDVLYVESGTANNNNCMQPLQKSWLRTLNTLQRKSSIGKTPCRRAPSRCMSCMNYNLCRYDSKKSSSWWVRVCQVLLFVGCVAVVFDAKRKQRQHRLQVQKYDEERAHILEQMTWIDRAAKRVHNNYYQKMLTNNEDASNTVLSAIGRDLKDVNSSTIEAIRNERDMYRTDLEKLRINIQSNAREKLQSQFGDNPIEVNLPLLSYVNGVESEDHLIIALWDDTPHAVSTLLQQVSRGFWKEINLQRLETSIDPVPGGLSIHNHRLDGIQLSPKANGSIRIIPTLEFVEKSRKCKNPGSVSLHQLESDDFQFTVLKVHVNEESHTLHNDESDVCIGNVVSGLDALMSRLPLLPVIHPEDDNVDDPMRSKGASTE